MTLTGGHQFDYAIVWTNPPRVEDKAGLGKSRRAQTPGWAWMLIILFPVVLRPWWLAIISLVAFALFVSLILGPLLDRNKDSE
jgi:hypothetical protein